MKTVSLKIPPALDARLEGVAKRRGSTKSAVLREILERFLSDPTSERRASILALAKDLVGCVDGPADLSSNPRHLQRYGR